MWALILSGYLVAALGLHALWARLRENGNRVVQFVATGTLLGLGLMVHLACRPDVSRLELLAATAAYAFACELYLFLITFVTSSVSVALLIARLRPDAAPSRAASGPVLTPAQMVEQRLQSMTASGLLRSVAGRYDLTAQSRLIVFVYRTLRRFFRHTLTDEFKS